MPSLLGTDTGKVSEIFILQDLGSCFCTFPLAFRGSLNQLSLSDCLVIVTDSYQSYVHIER